MPETVTAPLAAAPLEVPDAVETIFAVSGASAVKGSLATVYFAFTTWEAAPLLVVDWDLKTIAGHLPDYVPGVFARLKQLRDARRVVLYPDDIKLYVEPEGLGQVVALEAFKGGYDVEEVREDIAERDLPGRATPALVCVHSGQVKFARSAFEKVVNFQGSTRNHLRTQISAYNSAQKADDAELLTAWCTGVLQALETNR